MRSGIAAAAARGDRAGDPTCHPAQNGRGPAPKPAPARPVPRSARGSGPGGGAHRSGSMALRQDPDPDLPGQPPPGAGKAEQRDSRIAVPSDSIHPADTHHARSDVHRIKSKVPPFTFHSIVLCILLAAMTSGSSALTSPKLGPASGGLLPSLSAKRRATEETAKGAHAKRTGQRADAEHRPPRTLRNRKTEPCWISSPA